MPTPANPQDAPPSQTKKTSPLFSRVPQSTCTPSPLPSGERCARTLANSTGRPVIMVPERDTAAWGLLQVVVSQMPTPPLHGLQVPLYRPDCPFAIAITKPGTCCSPSGPSSLSQTPIDRYTGQELPIAFDAGYRALRRRPIGCRPLPRLRLPPFEKGHSHAAQCPVPSWQTPARPLPHQRPP